MANFLFIDTSSTVATVALGIGGEVLAKESIFGQNRQAAALNGMIENVLQMAGLKIKQLDVFCVCAGPGSYTGLRVGLSIAKGMAFALNKKIICFSRLQLIAQSFLQEGSGASSIGVLQQARKGEYFWAVFDSDGKEKNAPEHIFETELASKLNVAQVIITDVEQLPDSKNKTINLINDFIPDLKSWLGLAQQRWDNNEFSDIAYSEPFYLKPAFTTTPKKRI